MTAVYLFMLYFLKTHFLLFANFLSKYYLTVCGLPYCAQMVIWYEIHADIWFQQWFWQLLAVEKDNNGFWYKFCFQDETDVSYKNVILCRPICC